MKQFIQRNITYIGTVIIVLTLGLAWAWFSWKLAVVIFLALLGNNFEQSH